MKGELFLKKGNPDIWIYFKINWKNFSFKAASLDILSFLWGFGKKSYNPQHFSITILNFELGLMIFYKGGSKSCPVS